MYSLKIFRRNLRRFFDNKNKLIAESEIQDGLVEKEILIRPIGWILPNDVNQICIHESDLKKFSKTRIIDFLEKYFGLELANEIFDNLRYDLKGEIEEKLIFS